MDDTMLSPFFQLLTLRTDQLITLPFGFVGCGCLFVLCLFLLWLVLCFVCLSCCVFCKHLES